MDLRQIHYFLTLFEEQSVTRAARRLNIVQPALSMQIAKLEEELGRELFTRTARRMIPTPVAEEMDRLFRPLLREFNNARDQIVHSDHAIGGHIRIGIMPSIGQDLVAGVLVRFAQEYPTVTLSAIEDSNASLVDKVSRGQLDLAYTNSVLRTATIESLPVQSERLVLIMPLNFPTLKQNITQSELNAHKFVLPTRDHGLRDNIESALRQSDLHVVPKIEVDSLLAIARLVEKGLYVSFLPESTLHALVNWHGLKLYSQVLRNVGFVRQIVALHSRHRPLSDAARTFHQMMVGQLFTQLAHVET